MHQVIINPLVRKMNFEKMFRDIPASWDFSFNKFPKVDIIENETSHQLFVELPGVKKEDIKIVIENGTLTLSGEKKKESFSEKNTNVLNSERAFGKFERKFSMPDDVNPDEVKASFENGLLRIIVSKVLPEEPKEKIIEVK
jgi:HSP20 family protein